MDAARQFISCVFRVLIFVRKEFVDYPMLCYVDCFLVHCKFSRSQENLMRFDRHFGIPFYLKMFKRRIKLEKQLIAAIPYKKFLFYTVSRC